MILAVEDQLAEIVTKKLISEIRPDLDITLMLPLRGKEYLRTKAPGLNDASKGSNVFLFTDLDDRRLRPIDLIEQWVPGVRHPNFLFRVVVMETESWVLADRLNFASFLSVPVSKIPIDSDSVLRPKELVISLARASRKKTIRDDLVPQNGSTARVGPAYNSVMGKFINETWDIRAASSASESLRRASERIRTF